MWSPHKSTHRIFLAPLKVPLSSFLASHLTHPRGSYHFDFYQESLICLLEFHKNETTQYICLDFFTHHQLLRFSHVLCVCVLRDWAFYCLEYSIVCSFYVRIPKAFLGNVHLYLMVPMVSTCVSGPLVTPCCEGG